MTVQAGKLQADKLQILYLAMNPEMTDLTTPFKSGPPNGFLASSLVGDITVKLSTASDLPQFCYPCLPSLPAFISIYNYTMWGFS